MMFVCHPGLVFHRSLVRSVFRMFTRLDSRLSLVKRGVDRKEKKKGRIQYFPGKITDFDKVLRSTSTAINVCSYQNCLYVNI